MRFGQDGHGAAQPALLAFGPGRAQFLLCNRSAEQYDLDTSHVVAKQPRVLPGLLNGSYNMQCRSCYSVKSRGVNVLRKNVLF